MPDWIERVWGMGRNAAAIVLSGIALTGMIAWGVTYYQTYDELPDRVEAMEERGEARAEEMEEVRQDMRGLVCIQLSDSDATHICEQYLSDDTRRWVGRIRGSP